MIRKAKPSDLKAIVSLGLEALENDPYPGLVIDEQKVIDAATNSISSPSDFSYVSETEKGVVASVIAQTTPLMFYKRNQANVIQFYTREPNHGMPLLRELLSWWHSRQGLKALIFTLDMGADPRIIDLLKRLELKMELPVLMITK